MKYLVTSHFVVLSLLGAAGHAQELSRYMGGPAELAKAPNGAVANAEALKVGLYGFLFAAIFLSLQVDTLFWALLGLSGALRSIAEEPKKGRS